MTTDSDRGNPPPLSYSGVEFLAEKYGEFGFSLTHKRRKGIAYGPTPFGFRRVGEALVADPAEQNC